ncbi:MAG: outer membrane lipoprotein-sorting protein [Pontibacterium sp.]
MKLCQVLTKLSVNAMEDVPMKTLLSYLLLICFSLSIWAEPLVASDSKIPDISAEQVILGAVEHWRGTSSYMVQTMTVHRADWQRTMTLEGWTRGQKDALIRFTAPAKDAGNATLKLDQDMWIFTPKLNQVIKLPASMMAQSWMGSDFSYNDLAKSDRIVDDFEHRLIEVIQKQGFREYSIESLPKPDAPVVWGKEITRVRSDYVLLEQQFFDQEMVLLKKMVTEKIGYIDGRAYPLVLTMYDLEEDERWTRVETLEGYFNLPIPAYLLTLSNLRNPRPWSKP